MAPTLQDGPLLAAAYGVTVESLRFYAERGLLWPVLVEGVCYYTPRDRVRLEIILKGKRLGFSLSEIEKLMLESAIPAGNALPGKSGRPDMDRVVEELQTLIGHRDGLDLSIKALKAKLSGK